MQKRQYLKRGQSPAKLVGCIICQLQNSMAPSMQHISSKILASKYKYLTPHPNPSAPIEHLLKPQPSSHLTITYRQALKRTKQLQILVEYQPFSKIVTTIKPLVLERTSKDKTVFVHFFGQAYQPTIHRYFSLRLASAYKQKFKKVLTKNRSGGSTQEQLYVSPAKISKDANLQPKRKPLQPHTPQMRRLTRYLSNMIKQFDHNNNAEFHPSLIFEVIGSFPGHQLDITEMEKQKRFKKELEGHLSIIETKPIERLHTDYPRSSIDPYGIPLRGNTTKSSRNQIKTSRQVLTKKQPTRQSQSKHQKENMSPNMRIFTDYDCQIIKPYKKSRSSKLSKGLSPSFKSLSKGKNCKLTSRIKWVHKV